jgi:hypothetical protein
LSRGPGKWQRAILERLQTCESFYLTEILPDHTAAQQPRQRRGFYGHAQMAALRAAHRLAAQGHIAINTRRCWTNYLHWTGDRWQALGGTIVARPGVRINRTALQIAYEVKTRLQGAWPRSHERRNSSTKVPTLNPVQLGAVASAVKLLASQGTLSDAQVIELVSRAFIPVPVIQAALAQLKAEGHYQRLIDEARQQDPPIGAA